MSNTINVNYMTRACNQYQQKIVAKDQEKEDTRFTDRVREKSEGSGSIVGNSKTGYNTKTGKLSTKDGSKNEFVDFCNGDVKGEDTETAVRQQHIADRVFKRHLQGL